LRVTFVGTSDAFGAGGRRQAALLVETAGGAVLLDCAPTTGTGLAALGIARDAIDAIALSHFHADHFAGVPQLVLAAIYEDARSRPLVIAGPLGVEQRVLRMADAVGYPIAGRALPFPLRFVEVAPGGSVDLGPVRLEAFAVRHDEASCPHGLALSSGGQRLVYSGDTGWFDDLPRHARGADLFVCECTFYENPLPDHLSHRVLEAQRRAFDCGRIVLTHLGSETSGRRGALAFDTADDGLRLEV
jgi:ribonuclease BN (tRNA processing enzyme)